MPNHLTRGVLIEDVNPTSTHTMYTVVYPTGAITVDVHEMIDRWLYDVDGEIRAVLLILPDIEHQPIWVTLEDETDEVSHGAGAHSIEFAVRIAGHPDTVEYIAYTSETRDHTEQHDVWVHGFPAPPTVPDLPEA